MINPRHPKISNAGRMDANKEIANIKEYLQKKGVFATEADIVLAAIRIAKRLGAGNWTFVCELK